jgi:hypothetical protein
MAPTYHHEGLGVSGQRSVELRIVQFEVGVTADHLIQDIAGVP